MSPGHTCPHHTQPKRTQQDEGARSHPANTDPTRKEVSVGGNLGKCPKDTECQSSQDILLQRHGGRWPWGPGRPCAHRKGTDTRQAGFPQSSDFVHILKAETDSDPESDTMSFPTGLPSL